MPQNSYFHYTIFFKGWPSRWADFTVIQDQHNLPNHHFIKHCPSRWLTVENAGNRLLEQWEAVLVYFLKQVPKENLKLAETSAFKKISRFLKHATMKAEVLFLCSSARVFTRFTGTFQKDQPLIHVLHEELNTLLQTLAARVCKPVESKGSKQLPKSQITEETFKDENLLPLKGIVCSEDVRKELSVLNQLCQLDFLKRVKNHYLAACKYILQKAPVSSSAFLRHFRCLQPYKQISAQSCKDIVSIAKALPVNIQLDELTDEWKLLQFEKDALGSRDKKTPADLYWQQFFVLRNSSGSLKFPNVTEVVKASLSLSHGNADIERRFSSSGKALTDERASMSERTLNGIMTIKNGMKLYNSKAECVPITKELLVLARSAYKNYNSFLEERKRLSEKEKMKALEKEEKKAAEKELKKKAQKERKAIQEEEQFLKEKRIDEQRKRKAADKLFSEATDRLKKAVMNKSLEEVELAHAMLSGVYTVRREEEEHRKAADSIQKTLEKRKSSLITSFFPKNT